MTTQAKPEIASRSRIPKLGAESALALAGTVFFISLLVLTAMNAGPLWRDEANTANVAQMPSLHELWHNLIFESFPPLWPLLVRGCALLGLAGSDVSIRILGLYAGLAFLSSLWLVARWMGCRAPILSLGLLGSLPAFIFIIGANRAYGLASCLLVLSFGTIWRVVEVPSRARFLLAGFTCLLFAHCVHYDAIFLAAMLTGGGVVLLRRRQWKTLGALALIGVICAGSMLIYEPLIYRPMRHQGPGFVQMMQIPSFDFSALWDKLGNALTARSSGELGPNGPEVWLWVALLLGGTVVALMMQRARERQTRDQVAAAVVPVGNRADLALFCFVSMVLGVAGHVAFLLHVRFPTQSWYYMEMLCLCAISLDGLLGASWRALRPWGLLRMGLMLATLGWGARSTWTEAHTRRSNLDLIAAVLNKNAAKEDLIVVETVWEGITFNRYYHGQTQWVTVPPVDSHLVHRTDLVFEKMNEPEPMAPVVRGITDTLRSGHTVWLVGTLTAVPSVPPPAAGSAKWYRSCFYYWEAQVSGVLLDHALREQILEIPAGGPVNCLENLPLIQFAGYKSGPDGSAAAK